MKKLSLFGILLFSAIAANAQGQPEWYEASIIDMVFRVTGVLFCIYLISSFILTFVRMLLDQRLKMRMLDKGVGDEVVRNFLRTEVGDVKSQTMKWFIIFLFIGIGVIIVNQTQPLGLHSVAIVFFCIAFGYLAYYLFLKKTQN